MITTTTTQLMQARDCLDKLLSVIYAQQIANKIDVMMLERITPR